MTKKLQEEMMREIEKEKDSRQGFSRNIFREFDMENLRGFYMRSKREQLDFWAFFGINNSTKSYIFETYEENGQTLKRIHRQYRLADKKKRSKTLNNFLDHCNMNKVLISEVLDYDRLLQERLSDIEQVIDYHFQLIREVIEEEKLEKRERDIEKTFGKEDYR